MNLRSFLCFLLFFCCIYNAFSQTINYSSFPKTYGKWCVRREHYENNNIILDWTLYETAGDTTIGSFVYKKMNSTPTCYACTPEPPTYDAWSIPYGPKKLAFAYRNDIPNKKVYILADTNKAITGRLTQEYLWYDFDLKEGDTLKNTYALDLKKQFDYNRIIVKSIGSMVVCGNFQRRFGFFCETSEALMEGVGFMDNFIVTSNYCPFEPFYIYNTYFSCTQTAISETTLAKSISLFPNPVSNSFKIEWPQQNVNFPARYSIVDCLGDILVSNANVHEVIDVSSLRKGIYFITIEDNLGNYYKSKFIKQD
jgi:hypothetical protein